MPAQIGKLRFPGAAVTLITLAMCGSSLVGQGDEGTKELRIAAGIPQIGPIYRPTTTAKLGTAVYLGEPLLVRVSLVNEGPETLQAPSTVNGWAALVRLDLQTVNGAPIEPALPFQVVEVRDSLVDGAADPTAIQAGRAQRALLRLPIERFSQAGQYQLRVSLQPDGLSNLSRFPRVRLATILRFELIPTITVEDRLNLLYAHAFAARTERRLDEARSLLTELLAIRPNNTSAWYELGRAWADGGQCTEASIAFGRAVAAANQGGDSASTVRPESRVIELGGNEALERCLRRR